MALVKMLKHAAISGILYECQVFHIASDGTVTQIDHADGIYRASPATPKIPLVEVGTTGLFTRAESRSAWADGNYVMIPNVVGMASPDGGVEFEMKNDAEVVLNASAEAILAAVLGTLPQTAHTYNAGERIVVPQGDVMNLPFALGSAHDCTGKRLYFYAWDNNTGQLFITKLECTLTDALNVIGTVPLTAVHLASLRSCTYEYVRFDADGISNKHTIVQGPMVIDDSLAI